VAVQWRSEFANIVEGGRRCGGYSSVQCSHLMEDGANACPDGACKPPADEMRAMLKSAMELTGSRHLFLASDAPISRLGPAGEVFAEFGAVTQDGGAGKR
jgi:hypothetical protein